MESQKLLVESAERTPRDYGCWSGRDHRDPSKRTYLVKCRSSSVSGQADEDLHIQQAVVLIEDAIQYRSINHRVDARSLRLYRWYYSRIYQWTLGLTIGVVLLLAFVERPSSLSITSDSRYRSPPWEPPCGFTESIEIVCLIIFTLDLAVKSYLIGWDEFRKNKWLMSYTIVTSVSIIDWVLSISMVCDEKMRVRRFFRPFFLLQNSSLMKKTLKCIRRTLPEIASVILLLALHLCLFTMIGMLLFPKTEDPLKNEEWKLYFRNLSTSLTSLLVLLTTANNPDVMIPAYSLNRGYAIFFVSFSVIGTYCLMNLLTAIIYNQFRGYLLMSVQTSIIRRRLGIRAAFQVLSSHDEDNAARERVPIDAVLQVMSRIQMQSYYREAITTKSRQYETEGFMNREQFKHIFDELDKDRIEEHPSVPQYNSMGLQKLQVIFSHYYFAVFSNAVAMAHVVCICVLQITIYVTYGLTHSHMSPSSQGMFSLQEMVRFVNMLIVFRFLRIIPDIKLMALVASTLLDLVKNLRAFAGILVVVYYIFAVFGIWLFEGVIKPPAHMSVPYNTTMENTTSNFSPECGTYEQLGYWPNNFDDFAGAIILLYDIMIVNNWQAFMDAYTRYTTEWSKIYFVCWWFTSSVMWVNLFVALILENFTYKWDRSHSCSVTDVDRIRYEATVQLMFKEQVKEPTEEELLCQLQQHRHLHLHWGHTTQTYSETMAVQEGETELLESRAH
ncbi:two pore calcium channel protein 2 isoform X7 [Syngnathus acus]|uniref:two pore calcium channel protein 2 isoform X7 n=1 Tax=Syngnathus acus TaxID=161584 RepID=UPI0018864A36|nr:two pore calcium channel protein 2 isoform X7 [Syngnathus acus]